MKLKLRILFPLLMLVGIVWLFVMAIYGIFRPERAFDTVQRTLFESDLLQPSPQDRMRWAVRDKAREILRRKT
ncbi:MAG: hypothetical protein KDC70_00105 [Saprospiraceae bacterium]|nr:hypothetical protein [Saprospiraceae bacterium]